MCPCTCTTIGIGVYVYICMCMCTCTCTRICICICMCVCVCLDACMYLSLSLYIYIYIEREREIHIHTHVHTCTCCYYFIRGCLCTCDLVCLFIMCVFVASGLRILVPMWFVVFECIFDMFPLMPHHMIYRLMPYNMVRCASMSYHDNTTSAYYATPCHTMRAYSTTIDCTQLNTTSDSRCGM